MITYNHERFIGQAIESALMQRAAFPYELVIGDDCSTDRTPEIIHRYAERHPDIIRPLETDRNLGMLPNFRRCWEACRGQYIAILEGDDYWTSPNKLRRQIDAMDQHPEWALCFQRVQVIFDDGRPPAEYPAGPQKPVFTVRDLLLDNPIQTCGVVYRAGLLKQLPESFEQLALGDWPMAILHALHGDIGFLDEVMAVYRWHSGASWSPMPFEWKLAETARMFDLIRPLVDRRLGSRRLTWHHDAKWAALSMKQAWLGRARRHARRCVRALPFRPYSWRLLLWTHLGRLGRALDPKPSGRD